MTYKEKLIQQTEHTINRNVAKCDELYDEIATIEEETSDARATLHFLKTGLATVPPPVDAQRERAARGEGARDEGDVAAAAGRRRLARRVYLDAIDSFGDREFTARDLSEKVGINPSSSAAVNMAKILVDEQVLVQTERGVRGGAHPTPNKYRKRRSA